MALKKNKVDIKLQATHFFTHPEIVIQDFTGKVPLTESFCDHGKSRQTTKRSGQKGRVTSYFYPAKIRDRDLDR